MEQVVFYGVSLTKTHEVASDFTLTVLHLLDGDRDLHGFPIATLGSVPAVGETPSVTGSDAVVVGAGAGDVPMLRFVSRTAATLNVGCFDTGSHAVIVSSFAA